MTKVFGSTDAVTTELGVLTEGGIGGTLVPIDGAGGGGGSGVDSVNGQTGVVVLDTDDITEGVNNLYVDAAQTALIASAMQPGDNVSSLVNDAGYLTSASIPVDSVNGQTGAVVLDADDIDDAATTNKFATSAELALIASATQPGDNISTLTNDAGYITSASVPVDSVNGLIGIVVLNADDISDAATTNKFATDAELALIASATQPGDNVSTLVNDAGYITSASVPVDSVNGQTGIVVLDADDISDAATTNKFATSADLALIASATQPGDNVSTLANDAGYITSASVPVDSVNGQTGAVVLDADDIDDAATTNKFATSAELALIASATQPGDNISTLVNDSNFITSAGAPVQSVNSQSGSVVLDADDISDAATTNKYVTSAQLTLINAAIQPGDNVSDLTNDAGYLDAASAETISGVKTVTVPMEFRGGNQTIAQILLGNDSLSQGTLNDSTVKNAKIACPPYNTAQDDILALSVTATTGSNAIFIGGGSTSFSAATQIQLRTAAAVGTAQGDTIVHIFNDRVNLNAPLALLSTTVATLPTYLEGALIYVSDGDSGSPCIAAGIGGSWLRLTTGAAVSTS